MTASSYIFSRDVCRKNQCCMTIVSFSSCQLPGTALIGADSITEGLRWAAPLGPCSPTQAQAQTPRAGCWNHAQIVHHQRLNTGWQSITKVLRSSRGCAAKGWVEIGVVVTQSSRHWCWLNRTEGTAWPSWGCTDRWWEEASKGPNAAVILSESWASFCILGYSSQKLFDFKNKNFGILGMSLN